MVSFPKGKTYIYRAFHGFSRGFPQLFGPQKAMGKRGHLGQPRLARAERSIPKFQGGVAPRVAPRAEDGATILWLMEDE